MRLNGRFPGYGGGIAPCVGVDEIGVDDATRAIFLIKVKKTVTPAVDLTGCSTIFLELFYELEVGLSVDRHVILGRAFPFLKRVHPQIPRTFHA